MVRGALRSGCRQEGPRASNFPRTVVENEPGLTLALPTLSPPPSSRLFRAPTTLDNATRLDLPRRPLPPARRATLVEQSKEALAAVADEADKKSNHVKRTIAERQKEAKLDPLLESQFSAGRLYAVLASRPGQSGRADGYILEGKELEFYVRRLRAGKAAKH